MHFGGHHKRQNIYLFIPEYIKYLFWEVFLFIYACFLPTLLTLFFFPIFKNFLITSLEKKYRKVPKKPSTVYKKEQKQTMEEKWKRKEHNYREKDK